jgi:dihydrolipoamide dehydrogenase
MHTQLAVLGGGPGGYAAAFMAADLGAEVTVVEADSRLGGTCLLRGCIPSKALLHVARVIGEVDELREDWGVEYGPPKFDLDKIRARKNQVIETLTSGLAQLAKRRKIRVIHARGQFENSTTLKLSGDGPGVPDDRLLTYDHVVLATGSEVACPTALAVDSPRVMDSTSALDLADVPESLLVVGGGYIGLEMGTVYAKLGSQVSVVELTDGLLPGADRNLVKPLHKRLDELFEGRIFLNTRLGSLGERGNAVEAAFEGPQKYGTEHYDRVLIAVGRRPRTQGIGLENTQVELSHRGFVVVDRQQRTDLRCHPLEMRVGTTSHDIRLG